MKLKLLVAVAVLTLGASASQAADYPFAMPLSPQLPFSSAVPVFGQGAFSDDWMFTAPLNSGSVSGAAISVNLSPFYNIDSILIRLFDSSDNLVATGSSGSGTSLTDIPVVAGDSYYFEVSGSVTGASNGFYTFTAVAAPIPEPGTYALMLMGLVAVGAVAGRRREHR
jgi:hypothetical protein